MPKSYKFSKSLINLIKNLNDVSLLEKLYSEKIKRGRGRKERKYQILLKSYLVLATACWEAFVEDLVDEALEFLLKECRNPNKFPRKVKSVVAEKLKKEKNSLSIWVLAGAGWKKTLKSHKKEVLDEYAINTPVYEKIDNMFLSIVGMKNLSSNWHWKGISPGRARELLDGYIKIRGDIAHRISTHEKLTMRKVKNFLSFIYRLSTISNNTVRVHLFKITKKYPWGRAKYRSSR